MARILLIGAPGARPALLKRLISRHQVTVLTDAPVQDEPTAYDQVVVPDLMPTTAVQSAVELRRRFHGVLSWDQMATGTANRVAESLELPPLWAATGLNLADKADLYSRWIPRGVPCPVPLSAGDLPDGPCIVKPGALMGAIGTRLCSGRQEAEAALRELEAALSGSGPSGWAAALLARYGLPASVLVQEVIPVDLTADGEHLEYTAEVAVSRGEPRLVCVYAKAHVPPPHFAETSFLVPPPRDAPVWDTDIRAAAYDAAVAAGLQNSTAQLEFCLSDGKIKFFELNPRLMGDPGPALIERVHRVPMVELAAAIATGDRTAAWRLLDSAALEPQEAAAFVYVRAGFDRAGQTYRGLDAGRVPLSAVDVEPVLTNGDVIAVSELRGPARVATVRLAAPDDERRSAWVDHWTTPGSVRTERPGPETGPWDGQAGHWSLGQPWLRLSEQLPGLRGQVMVTVEDEAGLAVGAPCWVCDRPPSKYDPGPATGLGEGGGPAILIGSRTGYSSRVFVRPGLAGAARAAAVEEFIHRVRGLADRESVDEAWVMHADPVTAGNLTGLPALQLPPVAEIPLGLRGHEEWLSSLPKRRRQGLRKEYTRWADQGEVVPLADVVEEAGPLLAAHNRRFGSDTADVAMQRFLRLHAETLGESARAFVLRGPDGLVAFAFAVEWGDRLVMRTYGGLGGRRADDGLYFYLAYHLPVRFAALRGISSIELGPGAYATKLLHGASLEPRWALPLVTRQSIDGGAEERNRRFVDAELAGILWRPPASAK